ncbi:hypothetical protein IPM19_00905 [bacterium]|nr:MAG: hypothetical protein IPM19_00905 [bacterium]
MLNFVRTLIDNFALTVWGVIVIFLFFFFLFGGYFFQNSTAAANEVKKLNFSNVEVVNTHWMAASFWWCNRGDIVRYDLVATDQAGKRTNMYVCQSIGGSYQITVE